MPTIKTALLIHFRQQKALFRLSHSFLVTSLNKAFLIAPQSFYVVLFFNPFSVSFRVFHMELLCVDPLTYLFDFKSTYQNAATSSDK